jgi:hypothetical protein
MTPKEKVKVFDLVWKILRDSNRQTISDKVKLKMIENHAQKLSLLLNEVINNGEN